MTEILTPDEKQYLRKVSNYLRSLGMEIGEVEFEMDTYDEELKYDDIKWEWITHFSNNYSAEIPQGLLNILQKIAKYVSDEGLFGEDVPDIDDLSWQNFTLIIDAVENQIYIKHFWSWYDRGDSSDTEWVGEDGKEIFDEWEREGVLKDLKIPSNGVLTSMYTGAGDSGYMEDSFDENGEQIPAKIEDWCYLELESHHGGWEINEGSDGHFIFDFKNKEITLNHTYNLEKSASDTIWEEKFGKNEK